MSKKRYTVGVDFGTLSARAAIMDVEQGIAMPLDCVYVYPHAVLTELGGKALPSDYALAHPRDYIDALEYVIKGVMEKNRVDPSAVEGIGIDATACTVVPVDADCVPLCFKAEFENEPHAYIKLWKHHGAEKYMDRVRENAERLGESFPQRCGTGISSELFVPKALEIVTEAPDIYEAADKLMNLGDFIARTLTGKMCHSSAYAAIKECWDIDDGFPGKEYLKSLDARLENMFEEKLGREPKGVSTLAGYISQEWARKTGLSTDTAVALGMVDAHAPFMVAGIEDGLAVMAVGTSSCLCVNSSVKKAIGGIMSCGSDAIARGMMTYDAGLCCVGDLFDWFVKNCVPEYYEAEAREKGIGIHKLLRQKAETKSVGESGLVALGWWNGNRSTLADGRLSGVILGMKLSTRPEDIYRALIEATAYGMRNVLDNYENNGVKVSKIMVTGGIAKKDPMLMQIYADVFDRELFVMDSDQCTALGSAACGAVASGRFKTEVEASHALRVGIARTYSPVRANAEKYARLYKEYMTLHDYFGRGGNDVMKRI